MTNPVALVAAMLGAGMLIGYGAGKLQPTRFASMMLCALAVLLLLSNAFTTKAPKAPGAQPERQCIVIDMRSRPAPPAPPVI